MGQVGVGLVLGKRARGAPRFRTRGARMVQTRGITNRSPEVFTTLQRSRRLKSSSLSIHAIRQSSFAAHWHCSWGG